MDIGYIIYVKKVRLKVNWFYLYGIDGYTACNRSTRLVVIISAVALASISPFINAITTGSFSLFSFVELLSLNSILMMKILCDYCKNFSMKMHFFYQRDQSFWIKTTYRAPM